MLVHKYVKAIPAKCESTLDQFQSISRTDQIESQNRNKMSKNLNEAAMAGNLEEVLLRLNLGEDVNQMLFPRYSTPLHDATTCGRIQVAKVLIERYFL